MQGCGYTIASVHTVSGEPYRLAVAEVREVGIDVDAAGFVSTAVRRAVARGQGLELASKSRSMGELDVEILDIQIGLGAFADPSLRASRYQVLVSLRGRLLDNDGFRWTSPTITGAAPFFSTPGPIESLDGAGRRALEQASVEASERLVQSVILVLEKQLTRSASSRPAADAP